MHLARGPEACPTLFPAQGLVDKNTARSRAHRFWPVSEGLVVTKEGPWGKFLASRHGGRPFLPAGWWGPGKYPRGSGVHTQAPLG